MSGYKRWLRLEELTSDDVNGFLGGQVIARFPSHAARDAALPFPEDGQPSYVVSVGSLEIWSASRGAWGPPANVPVEVAYNQTPATFDVSGTNVVPLDFGSFTARAGVRYRLDVSTQFEQDINAGHNLELKVRDVTVVTQRVYLEAQPTWSTTVDWTAPTAGPARVHVAASIAAGSSRIKPLPAMTQILRVVDLGAITAPPAMTPTTAQTRAETPRKRKA